MYCLHRLLFHVSCLAAGAVSGAVAGYWRNMALYQLGAAFNRRHIYGMLQHRPPMYYSTGTLVALPPCRCSQTLRYHLSQGS